MTNTSMRVYVCVGLCVHRVSVTALQKVTRGFKKNHVKQGCSHFFSMGATFEMTKSKWSTHYIYWEIYWGFLQLMLMYNHICCTTQHNSELNRLNNIIMYIFCHHLSYFPWRVRKCRSTFPFFGIATVDWQTRQTHFENVIVKKKSSSHSVWKW